MSAPARRPAPHSCITSATAISAAGTISRSRIEASGFVSARSALGVNAFPARRRPLPRKKREKSTSTASAQSTEMSSAAAKFFAAPAPRKYAASPNSSRAMPASANTGSVERQARRRAVESA